MDTIPVRRSVALPYRAVLTFFEKRVFLPNINPSYYSVAGIVLSALFLYTQPPWLKVGIIVLVILADWLDGATARRYNKMGRPGYIIDVVSDRVSEAFIFSAEAGTVVGQVFFFLWLVNLILAFYSARSNKHTSLPLRFAYIAILIV